MISKELLSEVLGVQIFKCFVNNGICSYHDEYFYKDINIYELAHRCKEWAYKKGFEIIVLAYAISIYKNSYEVYHTNTTLFDLDMFFKACEWILKEGN